MRILITGGLGWTARSLIQTLHNAYHEVAVLDVPSASVHPDITHLIATINRGNIAYPEFVQNAMQRIDMIVHLALAVDDGDYDTPDIPFTTNVLGTYNVFEAARQNNIQRVILMSSAPVHLNFPPDAIVDANLDLPTAPDNGHLYDLTKRLQEQIAKDYVESFGLNVVTLRAGHIVDSDTQTDSTGRALADVTYCRGGWVCRYDLANAVLNAVEFQKTGYHAFNVISDVRAYAQFELSKTKDILKVNFEADFSNYSIGDES